MNNIEDKASMATGIGLRCAINILTKWELTHNQKKKILRINDDLILKACTEKNYQPDLNYDQILRISLILNMHTSLRTTFERNENAYKFMLLKNANTPFNGNAPIDMILFGDIATMYHVCRAIQKLPLIGLSPFSH